MGNWVVAFLDMLGYRSVLSDLDAYPIPDGPGEHERLERAVGRAIKLRRRLLGLVDTFVGQAFPPPDEIKLLTQDQRAEFLATKRFEVHKDPGPDHIVLKASLAPTSTHFPVRAVCDLLQSAALLTLMQLYIAGDDAGLALPLRGGISLAPGILVPQENFLYSPALTCAYELESKHAKVPRILVDERVVQYLDAHKATPEPGVTGQITRTLASTARDLIILDPRDNRPMLDFYGPAMARMLDGNFTADMSSKARTFVRQSLDAAKAKADPKLRENLQGKYEWLTEYMEGRAKHWPQ